MNSEDDNEKSSGEMMPTSPRIEPVDLAHRGIHKYDLALANPVP